MKAIKLVETKTEGEFYTNKYHKTDIPISYFDLENLISDIGADEDYESAYFNFGVSYFFDECVYSVDINDFIKGVEVFYENDEMPEYVVVLLKVLEKYFGYVLYPAKEDKRV